VVHRDVKPANIMISEEIGTGDHVRILDFGLARLRGAVGRDATQTNVVVGTPNYMAPEQTVGGGLIDARTDIYAVGVVLFEMVCGERPFQAEDTLALLGMHRAAPIPSCRPDAEATSAAARLQDVIDKAMAKSPGDRFQSAIELAEAIDGVAAAGRSTRGAGDRRSRAPPRRRPARRRCSTQRRVRARSQPRRAAGPAARRVLGSLILLAILLGGVGAAVCGSSAAAQQARRRPRDRRCSRAASRRIGGESGAIPRRAAGAGAMRPARTGGSAGRGAVDADASRVADGPDGTRRRTARGAGGHGSAAQGARRRSRRGTPSGRRAGTARRIRPGPAAQPTSRWIPTTATTRAAPRPAIER
jgi:hypothetical protein